MDRKKLENAIDNILNEMIEKKLIPNDSNQKADIKKKVVEAFELDPELSKLDIQSVLQDPKSKNKLIDVVVCASLEVKTPELKLTSPKPAFNTSALAKALFDKDPNNNQNKKVVEDFQNNLIVFKEAEASKEIALEVARENDVKEEEVQKEYNFAMAFGCSMHQGETRVLQWQDFPYKEFVDISSGTGVAGYESIDDKITTNVNPDIEGKLKQNLSLCGIAEVLVSGLPEDLTEKPYSSPRPSPYPTSGY